MLSISIPISLLWVIWIDPCPYMVICISESGNASERGNDGAIHRNLYIIPVVNSAISLSCALIYTLLVRIIVISSFFAFFLAIPAGASRAFDANELNLFSSHSFNRIASGELEKTPTSVAKQAEK